MPREGYKSTGSDSLPEPYIKAIKELMEDPKFIAEMHAEGHVRISRALVIRKALQDYLKGKGFDIGRISEAEDK